MSYKTDSSIDIIIKVTYLYLIGSKGVCTLWFSSSFLFNVVKMGSGEHRWLSWQKNYTRVQWRQTWQQCRVWWRRKVSFVHAHVCSGFTHTHIWRTAKLSDKTHTYWIHLHLRANKTVRSMSSLKTSSCIRYLIPSSPPLLQCVSTTISPLVLKFFLSHPLYRATERIVGAWGKYKKWGPYYRLCEAGSGARSQEILRFYMLWSVFWGLLRLLFEHTHSTYLPVSVFV